MKRLRNLALALGALIVLGVAGGAIVVAATTLRPARPVGVAQVLAPDPGHAAIPVTIFYPAEGRPRRVWIGTRFARLVPKAPVAPGRHPLVLLSSGTAATPTSHVDTVLALAEAGYVVAVPLHAGDNLRDQSAVGRPGWIAGRAREIARTNDFMLQGWAHRDRLDPARVGLFGFSAGGATGLVALGGVPDLARAADHCARRPELVCRLMSPGQASPGADDWTATPGVRAAVIVAPGLGFAFAPDGLAAVKAPVQLWQGAADVNVPPATNAVVVRSLLPASTEFHLVPRAGHAAFLAPCGPLAPLLPRMVCADPAGFDRAAFHRDFNAAVVRFFDSRLGGAPPAH